jgi:hypothetical protein
MTDLDDELKRRYRELAQRGAAGRARRRDPGARARARRAARSLVDGPVSIAAVLVLGIGVSLRMQLEQPGIESSVPAPAAVPERPAPATPAAPATTVPAASELARDSAAPVAAPEAKRTAAEEGRCVQTEGAVGRGAPAIERRAPRKRPRGPRNPGKRSP